MQVSNDFLLWTFVNLHMYKLIFYFLIIILECWDDDPDKRLTIQEAVMILKSMISTIYYNTIIDNYIGIALNDKKFFYILQRLCILLSINY